MPDAAVFIYRGGLIHWFDIEAEEKFVAFPDGRVYPKLDLSKQTNIILVDRNVVTGKTLERTTKNLGLQRKDVIWAGSCFGEYAKQIVDIVLPPADIQGYLLAFSGPPGAAKSFFAKGIAEYRNLPYYKVGRYAKELNPGKYGELLAEKEKEDPFIVVKAMAADAAQEKSKLVVVDGFKTLEQAVFLSYVLRRPVFGFYVTSPFAEKMIELRKDSDDFFAKERETLFKRRLGRLQEMFTPVFGNDFQTLLPVVQILEHFGFKCPLREWGWDVFGTKRVWLDVYKKLSLDDRYALNEPDIDLTYHMRYVEKYRLTGTQAQIISSTATAFRLIDDILDEHRVRWNKPAYWVQTSCIEALSEAVVLTAKARCQAREIGLENEFIRMFFDVLDAVYYELDVEEGRAEYKTQEDWEKAAKREACFRAFIGLLKGEDPTVYYQQGLRAQIQDDIKGAQKGGRNDTDSYLNRPLWQNLHKIG